jgi:FkbH-like protein
MASPSLNVYLAALFTGDPAAALSHLEQAAASDDALARTMLRLALQRPAPALLQWRKLHNVWIRLGRPMLKPNPLRKRALLIADSTVDGFPPDIALASAAYGVDAQIDLAPYDSVEQTILSGDLAGYDAALLLLSEEWLRKHLGGGLFERARVDDVTGRLADLIAALRQRTDADIVVANLPGASYYAPAGTVRAGTLIGWSVAVALINAALHDMDVPRSYVLDVADAVFGAGGRRTLGTTSFFRARIAYEPPAAIAIARAIAAGLAGLAGKGHRALVTDWDNTIWGGEIAELGARGVVCGQDTPDALAFSRVQAHLKALPATGVLLAAVSRNDPAVAATLADNPDFALDIDDFASVQVSWDQKSQAIARVAASLGFGSEFMVYLDDSVFEIAEVVTAHPDIDVVLAGPQPQMTLERLGESRYFSALRVIEDDLQRAERAASLRRQTEHSAAFSDLNDFLRNIQIVLQVAPRTDGNFDRIVQLLHKTNQFNLTTRRHTRADLEQLDRTGAATFGFTYEDVFGSQGLIAAVVLVPSDDAWAIDSWVMSCRVLNRTVELAVFDFLVSFAAGRPLTGTYIPTEKNALVRDLYERLGFRRAADGGGAWRYDPAVDPPPPPHHATLVVDPDIPTCLTTNRS